MPNTLKRSPISGRMLRLTVFVAAFMAIEPLSGALLTAEAALAAATQFHTLTPCRVIDTRNPAGALGGPLLAGSNAQRSFTVTGVCGIPFDATSLSANITVTGPAADGSLKAFSAGSGTPVSTVINFRVGQTRANNVHLSLSTSGAFTVESDGGATHFILDVNGYYVAAGSSLSITTASLTSGTVGVGYGQSVAATGGQTPYTWSVSSGLPPGLAINATVGSIFGTPTAAGTFSFTATVRDASSPQQTASRGLSITIAAATPTLTITTTSMASGTVGVGYGQSVAATGGQTPYTWSVSSGLPPGLAINASVGSIFGTPTAAGTFGFTVTVRDASSPQQTTSKGLSITIAAATPTLTITTTSMASGTVGVGYGQGVAATGGQTPYTWSVSTGLPPGLAINASVGSIFGTPTTAGTYGFTVTVRDASSPQQTATKGLSITIAAATPTLTITTTSMASGTVGVGYGQGVTATGGQTPYTWSVPSGLPPGLAINASVGSIFGTPTAAGTFSFTVTVRDASSPQQTASKALSIAIAGGGCGDERDQMIAEYVTWNVNLTPTCSSFTQSAHSVYFTFAELNVFNEYSWAIIRSPLTIASSAGYGLDKWRVTYGSARYTNSVYRAPAHNAQVGGVPQSRHMFGDAVDLRNVSQSTAEWNAMVTAAGSSGAKADYIEPLSMSTIDHVHADWQAH